MGSTTFETDANTIQPGYHIGTLVLNSQTFTGTSPYITQIEGHTLKIKAEKIIINGHLSVVAPYQLELIAEKEIVQNPGSSVAPNIALKIFDFNAPYNRPVDQSVIEDFCAGNLAESYLANVLSTQLLSPPKENGVENPGYSGQLHIYPNPADDLLVVELPPKGQRGGTMYLMSSNSSLLLEKKFGTDLSSGFELDLSDLKGGMYILLVKTDNGHTYTSKIIKH